MGPTSLTIPTVLVVGMVGRLSRSCRGKTVDRIDAMKVFVTALDEGSLAAAGRKLGRSAAAVSRAISFLRRVSVPELLHRTTRSIKTSGASG